MNNTLISLILLFYFNSLKKDTNYNISSYIVNHLDEIKNISIKKLAKECYTSNTSISNFYKSLGFNSFMEFKSDLITSCYVRVEQMTEKQNKIDIDSLINVIDDLTISLDKDELLKKINMVVQLIHEKKKIYFYGALFPLSLTKSFCEDMLMMGIPFEFCQTSNEKELSLQKEGIHIIASFTGSFMELYRKDYENICRFNEVLLISRENNDISTPSIHIQLPEVFSNEYDDIIFLIILDLIKHQYFKKYFI